MQIEENVPLGPLTTLKIGGAARWFVRATDETELVEAVRFGQERELPVFFLGGGSNLVVKDTGFAGLVVQVAIDAAMLIEGPRDEFPPNRFTRYVVPAGMEWDSLVRRTCEAGFSGMECLAGIPGLVGGAPVQNIGAYGREVSRTIAQVHALDLKTLKYTILPAATCGFGYRRSVFNSTERGRYVITRVAFDLSVDVAPTLEYADLKKHFEGRTGVTPMEVYEAVRGIRAAKGMLIDPETAGADERSAGSFFKNPVVSARGFRDIAETTLGGAEAVPHWVADGGRVKLAAAWLIEQAGFKKGFALGRVGISSKHTLALVNRTGDATCEELLRLRDLIVLTVEQRFGVTLEMEPVLLG